MPNPEQHILPNGLGVDYYPESHTYMVNGKVLPSITTLLKKVYGDTYAVVNPLLLKKSADYGTAVHDELQSLIEMRKLDEGVPLVSSYPEVENYFKFIEPIYKVKPLKTEKVVVLYGEDGQPAAAGRFDLLCEVDGRLTLADFKTTSTIHRQLVTAQLNMYLRAAIQSGYLNDDNVELAAIHLHGDACKLMPIVRLKEKFYLKFLN